MGSLASCALIVLALLTAGCDGRHEVSERSRRGFGLAKIVKPPPPPPLDEMEGWKVDAYARLCLHAIAGDVADIEDTYARAVDSGRRARLRPLRPSVVACRRIEVRAPRMARADEAAAFFGDNLEFLNPHLQEGTRYYRSGEHLRDNGARWADIDGSIDTNIDYVRQYTEPWLRRELGRVRPRVRASRLTRLADDPARRRLYLGERFAEQVALVMRVSGALGDEEILPTDGTLEEAVPVLAQRGVELAAFHSSFGDAPLLAAIADFVRCAHEAASPAPPSCHLLVPYFTIASALNREPGAWALPLPARRVDAYGRVVGYSIDPP